jgi:hypothetical protein
LHTSRQNVLQPFASSCPSRRRQRWKRHVRPAETGSPERGESDEGQSRHASRPQCSLTILPSRDRHAVVINLTARHPIFGLIVSTAHQTLHPCTWDSLLLSQKPRWSSRQRLGCNSPTCHSVRHHDSCTSCQFYKYAMSRGSFDLQSATGMLHGQTWPEKFVL